MTEEMRGRVIQSQSGFFHVKTDEETLVCQLRGRLKQGRKMGDIIAIGDWVRLANRLDTRE